MAGEIEPGVRRSAVGGASLCPVVPADLTRGELLDRIDELLEARYRSADLGNLDDPLAETVYILLSKQTRDAVYRRVFADLRAAYPRWLDVLHAPLDALEEVLRPAGFQRQRAGQLFALLDRVYESNVDREVGPAGEAPGDLTLGFLHDFSDEAAEAFLRGLPGIGPKSARCVLAYALDREAFGVDTHVHRIFGRLKLGPSAGRKADHDPYQALVPGRMRKRLHINLVHHGRAVCRESKERCGDCVLISFCERGRGQVGDENPVAVDLFAGAGGLGSGFRTGGFRIGLAIESNRHAAQTYRLNNPGTPVIEARINSKTRGATLRRYLPKGTKVAAVLAGPPCQGYSAAGRRRPEHPMNRLYVHVARIARQLKATWVVLENVPGVRSVNGHRFFEPIVTALEDAGFAVNAHLLRASDYGAPQRRLRYFFLGRRDRRRAAPSVPPVTHRRHGELACDQATLPETQTVTARLAEIPTLGAGEEAERRVDPDGTELLNGSTMRHGPRVVDKIAGIAVGEGPISYRRLDPVEAATLVAGHRALPVHPVLDRTISVREAALIQGFPLGYFFCGPRADQPLQVANAVPPPLAEAVARHLLGADERPLKPRLALPAG